MISASRLRQLLHYDPLTGAFTWLEGQMKGAPAGSSNNRGYIHIMIDGTLYKAHRLAWVYMTGEWPSADVDHKNMVRGDNVWNNLRSATRSQNRANTPAQANNSCGLKGVHWKSANRKWCAQIKVNGRKVYLGLFDTPQAAHTKYCEAALKHFGEFARLI